MIEKLISIGFTEIEAKIYIYLLNNPGENGTQISKKIGVSRSAVYNSLEKLEKEMILKLLPTNDDKKNYIAVDPSIFLGSLEKKYRDNFEFLKINLKKQYSFNTDFVYNLVDKENIYFKIRELVENTKKILIIFGKIDNEKINEIIERYKKSDGIYIYFEYNVNELTLLSDNKDLVIINKEKAIYTQNAMIITEILRRVKLETEKNR